MYYAKVLVEEQKQDLDSNNAELVLVHDFDYLK